LTLGKIGPHGGPYEEKDLQGIALKTRAISSVRVPQSGMRVRYYWWQSLRAAPPGSRTAWHHSYWSTLMFQAGWALAAAWCVLYALGAWRRPRNWTDRLGRGLGFCWLGSLLMRAAIVVLAQG
jgi:hypothetical protein